MLTVTCHAKDDIAAWADDKDVLSTYLKYRKTSYFESLDSY